MPDIQEFASGYVVDPERIQSLREQIPTLRYSSYLNYGAYGPLPDTVLASMFNSFEQQHRLGPFSVEANIWVEERIEAARIAVAQALRALPEQVAFGPSVSALCNTVLWGIDWRPGDHLVISDAENPGIVAAVHNLQARLGIEVTYWNGARMQSDEGLNRLEDAFHPKTRLLVVSHVLWGTGETLPIRRIARLCHERTNGNPIAVLVDGAQSFGAIPVTTGDLQCDYFIGTFHKWWCGPDDIAVLFARNPDSLLLTFAGWRSVDNNLRPHSGLRKIEIGTSPSASHAGLCEALALHERVGLPEQRHAMLQIKRNRLRMELEGMSDRTGALQVLTPETNDDEEPQSGIVSFRLNSGAHRNLIYKLESQSILVREVHNPDCIRACPHYFTTNDEIDTLLQGLEDYLNFVRRTA